MLERHFKIHDNTPWTMTMRDPFTSEYVGEPPSPGKIVSRWSPTETWSIGMVVSSNVFECWVLWSPVEKRK